MSKITIPPAALEAGTDIIRDYRKAGVTSDKIARAAFLAIVENWRGMSQLQENDSASIREMAALILPLTEKTDDKT